MYHGRFEQKNIYIATWQLANGEISLEYSEHIIRSVPKIFQFPFIQIFGALQKRIRDQKMQLSLKYNTNWSVFSPFSPLGIVYKFDTGKSGGVLSPRTCTVISIKLHMRA